MKDYDNPSNYPENPPWTMFFDGPLYEKYKEFMANKDFSKILLTSKLQLANQKDSIADVPEENILLTSKLQLANQKDNIPDVTEDHVGIDWWSMDHDNDCKDNPVASDTYNTVSDTFYRKFTRGKKEEKRRTRRTRAVILLIILVLLAVSLGTALIIHYFLVPKDDDIAPAQVNISFSGNTSIFGMTEDFTSTEIPSTIKPTTLSVSTVDTHEIDKVKDSLNRGGRLFEDTTRSNVTGATSQNATKQSTKSPNITTTTTVDPFDFFSMDENMTTTAQQNQTTTTGTIPKTTDPKPMTASITPASQTDSTTTTPTTTQTITTQQQTLSETDTLTTTASVETTSPTVGTSSSVPVTKTSTTTTESVTTAYATAEVTTSDDVPIETTTEQMMTTAQMEQITETSTTPITTVSITETTKAVSTTPIPTTPNKIDTLGETTTATLTTTKAVEPPQTSTMSVATAIPAESTTTTVASTTASPTTSSINNTATTVTETTTLDIGTEIVTTTQVAPTTTVAPIVTPTVNDKTTTRGSTDAPSTTAEPTTTTGTGESVTTPDNLANATNTDVVTPTTPIAAVTDEAAIETTTAVLQTTTEVMPHVEIQDLTAYKTDTAWIKCHVTNLGEFKSLSIIDDKYWSPVEVTLYSSGDTDWFFTKTDRHHVTHEFRNISGSYLRELTVILDIENVQCKDAGSYKCTVNTISHEVTKSAKLTVVGRPDKQVKIQLGPSIIEDRAFRVTAIWQAGYPTPWSNMSWMALDARNQTYNLEDYGEYRDYELKVDHFECETFLESAIVIFPKVHLNDTTVIVKPDMDTARGFVDDDMRKYLASVENGIEKIRVIPLNYCPTVSKEVSIPHPYTECTKFIRCVPGNLHVQQCPTGTCFYERWQECL